MKLPRKSLLALVSLMACDFPPKVCIGDCGPGPGAVEDPTDSAEASSTLDDDGNSTLAPTSDTHGYTSTTASTDTTDGEPVDVCAVTNNLEKGATCSNGVPEPGEFCFGNFAGGPLFSDDPVSSVAGSFDHVGGKDLLTSHSSRTVRSHLDGPEPYLDTSGGVWPTVFPADALILTGTGDLDGDGNLDAVGRRVGGTGDSVELLFIDGAAELLQAQSIPQDTITFGPEVVDWNQDGHLDVVTIAATNDSPVTRIVLAGDGTGQFSAIPQPELIGPVLGLHALGAFDADGAPDDFAVINSVGALAIKSGSDVTFTNVQLPPASVAHQLAVVDLDGDELGDIVVLFEDTVTGGVSLLVALQTAQSLATTTYRVHCGATNFALGDLDQDGMLDIAVGGPGVNLVTIRRGDGLGGFPQGMTIHLSSADQLHIADLTGDGATDIAALHYASASLVYEVSMP